MFPAVSPTRARAFRPRRTQLGRRASMDNSTLLMIATLMLGLAGVAAFLLMQEAPTKTKTAKGGLKPRGAR